MRTHNLEGDRASKEFYKVKIEEQILCLNNEFINKETNIDLIFLNQLLKDSIDFYDEIRNRHELFMNELEARSNHFKEGRITIVGIYQSCKKPIRVKTEFGTHLVTPETLLNNTLPNIKTAIDKTEYFINNLKSKCDRELNFSKVVYVDTFTDVIVSCPIHGDFSKSPGRLLMCQGCPLCSREQQSKNLSNEPPGWSLSNWIKASKKSKHFDSFKVYIIKCWNENEEFYSNAFPYKYEIVETFISEDAKYIFNKEQELKNLNKVNKYIPFLKFSGCQECFTKIF